MEPDFTRNAAFHDRLVAGYDNLLVGNSPNLLARAAFHDLVARYVPAGSTLLDFGCGTGLDAQHFAADYRVEAYDNSPGMVHRLEERCAAEIAAGRIQACSFPYPDFPSALPAWPAPHAVVANFAVLNSIRHLAPLFENFAQLLAPPGWIILSVLNSLHWSKVRTLAWWRSVLPSRSGPRAYQMAPYHSYLHSVPAIVRAAAGFRLIGRAQAGAMVRYEELDRPERPQFWRPEGGANDLLWRSFAHRLLGHFVFLVLRRDR